MADGLTGELRAAEVRENDEGSQYSLRTNLAPGAGADDYPDPSGTIGYVCGYWATRPVAEQAGG